MSTALAVCHGTFGRVTVYRLDKPMRTHAHREGHLTFLLSGPPAFVTICGVPHLVDATSGVAINPWQPHNFQPCSNDEPSVYLVAYICDRWLDRDQEGRGSLRFGANAIRVGTTIRSIAVSLAHTLVTNASYRIVNRYLNQLFDASFDEFLDRRRPGPPPPDGTASINRLSGPQVAAACWTTASPKASNSTMWRAMPVFRGRIFINCSARTPV